LRSGRPHQQQRFSLPLSQRTHPGQVLGEISPLLPDVEAAADREEYRRFSRDCALFGANLFFLKFLWLFSPEG
jgi:hypothetical protein